MQCSPREHANGEKLGPKGWLSAHHKRKWLDRNDAKSNNFQRCRVQYDSTLNGALTLLRGWYCKMMNNFFLLGQGGSWHFEKWNSKECKIWLVKVKKKSTNTAFLSTPGVQVWSVPTPPATDFSCLFYCSWEHRCCLWFTGSIPCYLQVPLELCATGGHLQRYRPTIYDAGCGRSRGRSLFSPRPSCHWVETHLCQPLALKSLLTRPSLKPNKSINL